MKGLPVRALGFVLMGAIVSLPLNFLNHKRYWESTIYSVQTVDLNIVSHSLPTKLSELLIQGNASEIHRTVNSNYGLFSIVVTNCTAVTVSCPNEKILYASKSYYGAADVTIADLNHQLFNILRNPPPLYPEWSFDNPHASIPIPLAAQNLGKPIGRVYYLRSTPPKFFADLMGRFTIKSPEDLLNIYIVTLELSIASFLLIWFTIEKLLRSHQDKKQALANQSIAEENLSKIRRQYLDIINTKDSIIKDYEQKFQDSSNCQRLLEAENQDLTERLRQEEYKRKDLETKIFKLQSALDQEKENKLNLEVSIRSLHQQIQNQEDRVEHSEQQANRLQEEIETLRNQEQAQLDHLQELQTQEAQNSNFAQQQQESLVKLQQELQEREITLEKARKSAQEYQASITILQSRLRQFQNQIDQANVSIQQKEQELLEISNQSQEQEKIIQSTQAELDQVRQSEQLVRIENEHLWEQITKLEVEKEKFQNRGTDLYQTISDIQNSSNITIEKLIEIAVIRFQKEHEAFLNEIIKENDKLRQDKLDIIYQLHQLEQLDLDESSDDKKINFTTVYEALMTAEQECPLLEVWDSAIESAYTLNNYSPNKVYHCLLILNSAGEKYFDKTVGTDLDDFFSSQGVTYTPRESPATLGRYGDQRKFWHRGQTKIMTRHLKVGRRLRIYFEFDEQSRKVQIGYCGKHLRIRTR